jgi:hypothetical protein
MVPYEKEKMFSGNNREREVENVIRQVGARKIAVEHSVPVGGPGLPVGRPAAAPEDGGASWGRARRREKNDDAPVQFHRASRLALLVPYVLSGRVGCGNDATHEFWCTGN